MACLIEAAAIRFGYPGHPLVLDGIDFAIEAHDRVAITGANGAGKSTLLSIVIGLLKPQAGTIRAFGAERRCEADFREVRRRVGFVFQDPDAQLFCPTVAEDIAFGPLNLGKSKAEALAIVDATLGHLHLEHLRHRVTYRLSGGEKRLVSLAAVLAMEPEVLLLDEPTNALDEGTQERLVKILDELPQALVVVSHDAHFRRKVTTTQYKLEGGRLSARAPRCRHAV